MSIDAGIALQTQPIKLDSPLDNAGKALSLRQLMLQNQSGQQEMDDRNRLRGIYAGATPATLSDLLWKGGFGKEATAHDKSQLDSQEQRSKINEQQVKMMSGLAGAFTALPPEQQAQAFPSLKAEWMRLQLPNADKIPDLWDPSMLPHLQVLAARGQSADKLGETAEFNRLKPVPTPGAPGGVQVKPYAQDTDANGNPIDTSRPIINNADGSFSTERTITIEAGGKHFIIPTIVNGQPLSPDQAVQAWREGKNTEVGVFGSAEEAERAAVARSQNIGQLRGGEAGVLNAPTVGVKSPPPPPDSPDGLRLEAKRLESIGGKIALDQAKEKRAQADRLDGLSLQAQTRDQADSRLAFDRKKFEFEQMKEQNELANKGKTASQKDKELANKLSDDFKGEPPVKSFRTIQPVFASMQEAAKKDTAASDLNMVYAIAKIFDPDSVVREGEQIMVVNAGGLPSKVQSWIGFVNGGQRLSPELRTELLSEGRSRFTNLKQAHDALVTSYTDQAKRWNIDPADVVRKYDITGTVTPGKGPRKEEAPKRRESDKKPSNIIDFNDLTQK